MTPVERLAVTAPDEDLAAALRRIGEHGVHQLPVVREGRLVGMLEVRDVMRWIDFHVQPPLGGRHATNP